MSTTEKKNSTTTNRKQNSDINAIDENHTFDSALQNMFIEACRMLIMKVEYSYIGIHEVRKYNEIPKNLFFPN